MMYLSVNNTSYHPIMCGIVGISTKVGGSENTLRDELVTALTYLQHRGQDSAGIATLQSDGKINIRKGVGLVSQVFDERSCGESGPPVGIGHVRYSTQGTISEAEAQPLYTNSPYGIALAHNGNLTNLDELKEYLANMQRHLNTESDSEILLNIFAVELAESPHDLFGAMNRFVKLVKGSYSVVAVIAGVGLVAFRDPRAIRPLCFAKNLSGYMFASESAAFVGSPYQFERDVGPGECILVDEDQQFYSHKVAEVARCSPCLFEYIYFARPDSIIDGISVYQAREQMGVYLAQAIRENILSSPQLDIDVVIPVPETSRTYAIKVAEVLQIPYREAFVKNRYIARTFIMSESTSAIGDMSAIACAGADTSRSKAVKMKLSTIQSEFKDKNVLIVDDSIVRGTTSHALVKLAKEAGAKRVWFASAAPPICFANRLGIDIPNDKELIAHGRSNIEIADLLQCDRVFYNDLDIVYRGLKGLAPPSSAPSSLDGFEISCFSE
jgi:amidophosphoribosyltransferase